VTSQGRLCYKPKGIFSTLPIAPNPLVHAFATQDEEFAPAFSVLKDAIVGGAFPGASIAITLAGRLLGLKAFGQFTYEPDSPIVTTDTLFDLASLTKVIATTTMAMILYERGALDLDTPVVQIVPEFRGIDVRRAEITLCMLLAHSSGLPAYEKLFLRAHTKEALLAAVFGTPLTADPGTKIVYSDIGFILLGVALERIAGEPLDRFAQREIFGPCGMARATFNPPIAMRSAVPPTVDDKTFRHRVVQGEVNDENASVMGGAAPHAGVFSTAADIALFAHNLLYATALRVRPEAVSLFTRRETAPPGTSRALGWDTPSPPSQAGQYFSQNSFGHLGYTGTSLWIDADRGISITLLTNRTWPDATRQQIKAVRPEFYDAVMEVLVNKG
jgi:CubicO group peptidase (beta-lactamase class C family)